MQSVSQRVQSDNKRLKKEAKDLKAENEMMHEEIAKNQDELKLAQRKERESRVDFWESSVEVVALKVFIH